MLLLNKKFENISAWWFAGLVLTIKFKYCNIFRFGIKTLRELKQIDLAEVEYPQTNNSGFMYE